MKNDGKTRCGRCDILIFYDANDAAANGCSFYRQEIHKNIGGICAGCDAEENGTTRPFEYTSNNQSVIAKGKAGIRFRNG